MSERLRILYVAYPLLPVRDTSAGGAEQMLWTLEREMHRRGHITTVAACEGSRVAGRLIVTGAPPRESETFETRNRQHQRAILKLLEDERFDLIHDESGSFFATVGDWKTPVLATLHLPRSFYAGVNWQALPAALALNCVSANQMATLAEVQNVTGFVSNGIAVERFPLRTEKQDYLLWLGRICEEKAPDLAIEVARRTGRPLILAGKVYPFRYHEEYFARAIAPRIGGPVRFIDSPSFEQKIELLARAAAVLIPSLVDETSSLVALEAMACGTPVVGFRRGAIPEIVADGKTGFLADDVESMAEKVEQARRICPEICRRRVQQHFSASRMAAKYAKLYQAILSRSVGEAA